jgi:3-methyl-2-oxobutanoate hydroxymethyltransferase
MPKITIPKIQEMKFLGEKISMLTAYDYTTAKILDKNGIEIILVGDSASMVFGGNESTLPITLEEIVYHGKAVSRAVENALIVIDLPFGDYQTNPKSAVKAGVEIMKQTKATAVKLEGGEEVLDSIEALINNGIPVFGHLGLIPQSINKLGKYRVVGKKSEEEEKLLKDAKELERAGVSVLVLEKIPKELAGKISKELKIPVIGIASGNSTDGQVLVVNDMLGLTEGFNPKFVRKYLNLNEEISGAVKNYVQDIKSGNFPNESESY